MIERYETASGENPIKFDLIVNQQISNGWRPYGNPYTNGKVFFQAMVLDTEAMEKLKEETKAEIADLLSKPGVKLTPVTSVSVAS